MAMSMISAVIQALEASPIFTEAFGDTWDQETQTGVAKVFTDFSDQIPTPYTVIEEIGENYEYMTAVNGKTNFTSPGQLVFDIYDGDRENTRILGFYIAGVLNDVQLYWPGINDLMEFRMARSMFLPLPDPSGPLVSILFRRRFFFEYTYSSSLPLGSL